MKNCHATACARLLLLACVAGLLAAGPVFAMRAHEGTADPGSSRAPEESYQQEIARRWATHDRGLQWLVMGNFGEWSNPDELESEELFDERSTEVWAELEYPGGSQTVFLYSGGLWVGALKNGTPIVSTCTDGDNGTNEYAPVMYWHMSSKDSSAKEVDDDGDWDPATDDLNADGEASADFDGVPGRDDDGDGVEDEETLNGVDDDGDGLIDEDVGAVDAGYAAQGHSWLNDDPSRVTAGDANGDGNPGGTKAPTS
jgi:hypothetical protein